jgi:hypothetical protein
LTSHESRELGVVLKKSSQVDEQEVSEVHGLYNFMNLLGLGKLGVVFEDATDSLVNGCIERRSLPDLKGFFHKAERILCLLVAISAILEVFVDSGKKLTDDEALLTIS